MKLIVSILIILLLAIGPASAVLTARVTPGYTFSSTERPTYSTLNLLGTPTITIFGTVDGSTGLTPGSVTGTMLADSVPDGTSYGSTLAWITISGGRALQVQAAGLVTNTSPIYAQDNSFRLRVDTNQFTIGTNSPGTTNGLPWVAVTLKAGTLTQSNLSASANIQRSQLASLGTNQFLIGNAAGVNTNGNFNTNDFTLVDNGTNGIEVKRKFFTSSLFTLPLSGGVVTSNTAHGLGLTNAPRTVRWVLVCQTNDCGYLVGDEVDVAGFFNTANVGATFSGGASSNLVFLAQRAQLQAVMNKVTGSYDSTLVPASWKAKCYAAP